MCEHVPCVVQLLGTYLLNVSIIGSVDELLQLSKAVGLGQCKDQLCFNVRLACLLTGHLQELHQVLPVPCTQQSVVISAINSVQRTEEPSSRCELMKV